MPRSAEHLVGVGTLPRLGDMKERPYLVSSRFGTIHNRFEKDWPEQECHGARKFAADGWWQQVWTCRLVRLHTTKDLHD